MVFPVEWGPLHGTWNFAVSAPVDDLKFRDMLYLYSNTLTSIITFLHTFEISLWVVTQLWKDRHSKFTKKVHTNMVVIMKS